MEDRNLENSFIEQFSDYENCAPPGVRLPELKIEEKYYNKLNIPK